MALFRGGDPEKVVLLERVTPICTKFAQYKKIIKFGLTDASFSHYVIVMAGRASVSNNNRCQSRGVPRRVDEFSVDVGFKARMALGSNSFV
jgi:hypothetical protein